MKIKRFFAKDMRTALSQVKEELGAEAVIMSNKKVTGGIEIVAAVDNDAQPAPPPPPSRASQALSKNYDAAKRKLADDRVELSQQQQPKNGGRFAKVLQHFQSNDAPPSDETEADSLSALLARQQKRQNNDTRQGFSAPSSSPRDNSRQEYDNRVTQQKNASPQPKRKSRFESNDFAFDGNTAGQAKRNTNFGRPRRDDERNAPKLDPSRYDSRNAQVSPAELDSMREEMAAIRKLLEHQVSGLMWQEVERREPMRAMMIKRLEKMGLSDELADQLACYIPEEVAPKEAWPVLLEMLADQIITLDDCILENGGVAALLGPTGVGKTTTIAKLAARAAMEHGPDEVALVTTDTYRIGAHEQLATYGRIMGCPVRVAKDADELAEVLYQLRHRRLVLLDTAGMGQRDIRLSEQLDALMESSGSQIKSYLVLPATAQRRVLQETIEHFRRIPLAGCIVTKIDECLSLGELINVTIQNALPVAYIADGQRVPEDIKIASGNYLVAKANELLEQELKHQQHFWSSDASDAQAADYYD
ncbi:flagellar biosynthesis protein FlhF [Thaumasiovibrio subtropicus]|uniref:flagellar biosynthesis protein FlhF n=1 Tax=Thaumasiovibrio subtropicus TaxID=1891207 RepID=UPI000B359F0E|nr:flagellar biosynthesis protein FlhF [Thaumasiovibrio subtropicus]